MGWREGGIFRGTEKELGCLSVSLSGIGVGT